MQGHCISVSEHIWVGGCGPRGVGELPAGGIRASQGTFSSFGFVFFCKKTLFRHFSGFKKHYVAFSKKLILALGERYKSVYRYVLCLNIIKFINEPPF